MTALTKDRPFYSSSRWVQQEEVLLLYQVRKVPLVHLVDEYQMVQNIAARNEKSSG